MFPESLLKIVLPAGGDLMPMMFRAGRQYPEECKAVREDIDNRLQEEIRAW